MAFVPWLEVCTNNKHFFLLFSTLASSVALCVPLELAAGDAGKVSILE
jgi:hypothetical protein